MTIQSAKNSSGIWFRVSVGSAAFFTVALASLVIGGLRWEWVANRFAATFTPLGAVVAASIASAGAAYVHDKQAQATERSGNREYERGLWERFQQATQLFANKDHFATRVAGVYALCGLADEWIRHHESTGVTDHIRKRAEVETITDLLSAHLRRNLHKKTSATASAKEIEALVNESILAQFAIRFRPTDSTSTRWAGLGIVLDLHGTDLSSTLWSGVDLTGADLTRADLTDIDLRNADLTGVITKNAVFDGADLRGARGWTQHQLDSATSAAHIISGPCTPDE